MLMGKGSKGSASGIIEILSQDLSGGTEDNLDQDSRCPDRDSNQSLPEHKPSTLPLYQPARYQKSRTSTILPVI
jgi:hypothetical protein